MSFLLSLVLILIGTAGYARDCFEVRLTDGSSISGVYVDYDDMFGEKYLLYSYRNESTVRRISMDRVRNVLPAACQDGSPKPTPHTLSDGSTASSSSSQDMSAIWKKAVEIITDGNDIRRKKRWADELKGRYVKVCGALEDVEAGRVKHRVRIVVRTEIKDPEFMYITANVAKGRELLLSEMNIGDPICVTGKIMDSRHIGTQRADETEEFLLELEKMMDPTKMMVDIVFDDCRIEKGTESDIPKIRKDDPDATPQLVI